MNTRRAEWIGVLTSICVLLGAMLAMTLNTQQAVRSRFGATTSLDFSEQQEQLQQKVASLQERLSEAETHKSESSEKNRLMMISAMMPAAGPGVIVTLTDNPRMAGQKLDPSLDQSILSAGMIHDLDILRVVNELFAADAEAIAVNNQRIGSRTAIRCVGPVVNVNKVACAAPYHIRAIGDSATLLGALNLPHGVLDDLKGVGCGVTVESAKSLVLPAYDGAVDFRYARAAPESRSDKSRMAGDHVNTDQSPEGSSGDPGNQATTLAIKEGAQP